MNIVLIGPEDLEDDGCHVLTDRRADHVRAVLGAQPGDAIRVGFRDGPLGRATIRSVCGGEVRLEAEATGPAPAPWLHLVLGVPRPKQLKKLLPAVAAMGLASLTFLRTWRVQRPYLQSPLLSAAGCAPHFEDGLMQAGRTAWPSIRRFDRFEAYCASATRAPTRIVADPSATRDIAELPLDALGRPVELVIGPEGGLQGYEVDRLKGTGFEALSFGESILRTDSACVAIVAQIDLVLRRSESVERPTGLG